MRYAVLTACFLLFLYVAWPYYHLYRLDTALGQDDTTELAKLVDMPAIRANLTNQLGAGIDQLLVPEGQAGQAQDNPLLAWLRDGIKLTGNAAMEQLITIDGVQQQLRAAAAAATDKRPAYLLSAVDYAFFESWDRFLVRLGPEGSGSTNLHLGLRGGIWRLIDIAPSH